MAKNFNHGALAFSEKLFERLLFAYPKAHRDEYGAAMLQLFRDQYRDAWSESQKWGVIKLWLRVLPDLMKTSIIERLTSLTERKSMTKLVNPSSNRTLPTVVFICVFLAVFLITIITATAITFILPESYASTARIKVEPETSAAKGQAQAYGFLDFPQTTFEILQSELVLKPVIDKLKLNDVWGKKYFNGETLTSTESLLILKTHISFASVRNTALISITACSDDPNEAAQIANAIAESYRNYRVAAAGGSDPKIQTDSLVQITDIAEPGRAPVKPNKPLNIFLGAVIGGFLGLVVGSTSAFVSFKFGNRARKNIAAT